MEVMSTMKRARAPSKAQVDALSARLRAMVDEVESWPLPDGLQRLFEELDQASGDGSPEPSDD